MREGKDGKSREVELTELYDTTARKWALPKGAEARIEGREEWVKDPFKDLGLTEAPRVFGNQQEVEAALDAGVVKLQDIIEYRGFDETIITTPGRIIFNASIREALFEAVDRLVRKLPEEHRPKLVVFGESFTQRLLGAGVRAAAELAAAGLFQVVELLEELLQPEGALQAGQEALVAVAGAAGRIQCAAEEREARIDARLLACDARRRAVIPRQPQHVLRIRRNRPTSAQLPG